MTGSAASNKSATVAWSVSALLATGLICSWLWFLRGTPGQPQLSQEQLNALATQAGKPGTTPARDADPYGNEAVKNAIREHALEIQKPWLAYLAGKPAQLMGAVTLTWTIAPDGKSTQVAVVNSDFEQPAFNEGVRAAVAAIAFPPPPGGQAFSVTHKLFFKQEPGAS